MTSDFKASTERNPDSKIYIDQWEIFDEKGLEIEFLMDDLKKRLIECSLGQDMIFIRNNDSIQVKKWNIVRSDDIEHIENRSLQLVKTNKNNLKLIRHKFYLKIISKLFNF